MILACTACILTATIASVFGRHAECPDYYWDPPNCDKRCHCAEGVGACRESDGHCLYGLCSPGWKGNPPCDIPCQQGHFGSNCRFLCHCPPGDLCSPINGLCDGGKCAHGWGGSSCQTELPVLTDPVQFVSSTKQSMTVQWRRWDADKDRGNAPVAYYVLEYQVQGTSDWEIHTTILADDGIDTYSHEVDSLAPNTAYRFRLCLGYIQYEKYLKGIASVNSPYYRTTDGSSVNTTPKVETPAPATTPSPETTAETTTKTGDVTTGEAPVDPVTTPTPAPVTLAPTPKPSTLPPEPVALRLVSRDQTSLRVEWIQTSDQYKWCWKKYSVTVESESLRRRKRQATNTHQVFETEDREAVVSGLSPGKKYTITVESVPEEGVLPFRAATEVWTLATYIMPPPRPKFLNATDTTLSVMLYAVDDYDANIKSYQVVVEDLTQNEKDNNEDLTAAVSLGLTIEASRFCPHDQKNRNKQHPNAYVTGKFDKDDLDPEGTVFKIGDGKQQGAIENVKLTKTSEYAVWFSAIYDYHGDYVTQIRRSKDTYIPADLAVRNSAPAGRGGLAPGYIALIFFVVLFFLILLAYLTYRVYQHQYERMKHFTKFSVFRRTPVPSAHEQSTQIAAPLRPYSRTPTTTYRQSPQHSSITTYKPRRSLYEELDFEASGPPIHVPKAQGVLTDASYVAVRNSNPIKVEKLKQYCMEREATDYTLAEEYRHLPIGLIDSVHAATKATNALLNRTSHILPYDSNRIRVKSIEHSGEGHDYINASLVKTHLHTFYVVTQCPMNTTMGEFWRMVWEQEVSVIVALLAMDEPDKPEYKAYWPKIDDHPVLYHDIRVSCNGTERSAHYAIRTFYISRLVGEREQIRCVRHYQYVTWTKTGVPKYTAPFLDFMERVHEGHAKNPKAMLVHCHSGGGRSGMFVAIHTLIKEGKTKRQVDVLKCVTKLRQERPNMVKHQRQYKFIYEALIDYFLCSDSGTKSKGFTQKYQAMNSVNRNANNSRTQLALEYEAIETLHNAMTTPSPMNMNNNSSSVLMDSSQPFVSPVKKCASLLLRDEPEYEQDLLVARIDSFCNSDTFIVANHSTSEQLDEFWSLVYANKCTAIVSLNSADACCGATQHLPAASHPGERPPFCQTYGRHVVSVSEAPVTDAGACIITDAVLHPHDDPGKSLTVRTFDFTNWCAHNDVPAVKHMLALLERVREWRGRQQHGAVLVHSNRGTERAIIFCLLWSVMERVDMEGSVNLFRAVLHHRRFVPSTIYNASQYRFLYQCVNDYISERSSCLNIATLNDIKLEEEEELNLSGQLLLHRSLGMGMGMGVSLCDEPAPNPSPSPTPSQLSAQIQQVALEKTMEDLSTWFSGNQHTVLERSVMMEAKVQLPDLDEEDLQNERQKNFDNKLLELFEVKQNAQTVEETSECS